MDAKKVRFTICGVPYIVSTDDSETDVLALAAELEADLKASLENSPSSSLTSVAVITALGYLEDKKRAMSGMDNMRTQVRGYLEDATRAKESAEEARRELEQLRQELRALKAGLDGASE